MGYSVFSFLVCMAVLVIVILIYTRLNEGKPDNIYVNFLRDDLRKLKDALERMERKLDQLEKQPERQAQETPGPVPQTEPVAVFAQEAIIAMPKEDEVAIQETDLNEIPVVEVAEEPIHTQATALEPIAAETSEPTKPEYQPYKKKKAKTDLEKYIGENVVNKIGIAILVIGIGFFVKYAIDKNWINETFRVFIGLACGGILIGLAHRLRKTYKAFSSVLIGGGLAVFYLTIAIAFHQYHILSQTVAFASMVAITCLAIALSLRYERQEIAILAVIGGFGTPEFLDTGHGNYIILFSYLLILNVGMLILASVRKWPLLNIICYGLTVITYGAWYYSVNLDKHSDYLVGALVFATSFYLVFFLMNIVFNIRQTKLFIAFDYGILLSNSFLYYWLGMSVLSYMAPAYQGLFTAVLALFNLAFVVFLYKKDKIDRSFIYLLIGLAMSFASLLGPVQLHGSYITMYWAAEAAITLFLSQRTGIVLLKKGSVFINILMLLSLILVWDDNYFSPDFKNNNLLANTAFVTGCFSIMTTWAAIYLLRGKEGFLFKGISYARYAVALRFLIGILLYLVPLFEVVQFVTVSIKDINEAYMIVWLYHYLFVIGLFVYAKWRKIEILSQAVTSIGFIMLFLNIAFYQYAAGSYRYDLIASKTLNFWALYKVHLPVLISLGFILYRSRQYGLQYLKEAKPYKDLVYWFVSFVIVFVASNEIYNIVSCISYREAETVYRLDANISKIGLPLVWGLCAFLFMRSGMLHKNRPLRIISLSLLLVTVLKLFIFDISNASEIGKIIAFICLGVVLLVISFMYQRIKKIIFDVDGRAEDDIEVGEDAEAPQAEAEGIV